MTVTEPVLPPEWPRVYQAETVAVNSRSTLPRWPAALAEKRGVTVIRQLPPAGYGLAMMTALRAAADQAEVVVTLDCDGTYPAHLIPDLAAMVARGECDVVNASRLVRRPSAMPWANWLANVAFARTTRFMHGLRVTDVHTGMRAYRSSMLRATSFQATGAALPVELLIKPARLGYRVKEVAIPYRERIGTSTLHRLDSTVWTFRRIFKLLGSGGRVPNAR